MRFKKVELGYYDTQTDLVWREKDEPEQLTYRETINLIGSVWRPPTIAELVSLVDYSICNPATLLPNIQEAYYWSSSLNVNDSTDSAWYVYFGDGGSDSYGDQNDTWNVRLILRGSNGQI